MFVGVGLPLNDPTNLLMSSILGTLAIIIYLRSKAINVSKSQVLIVILMIAILSFYFLSAIINNQSMNSFLLGAYQRNIGFITLFSLFIIFLYGLGNPNLAKNFTNFGLTSLMVLSITYGFIQYFGQDPLKWTKFTTPGKGVLLTLGNVNFAGALFGLLSVISFYKLFFEYGIKLKLLNSFFFTSTLFLGYETKSLQSSLVSIICIVIFLTFYNLSKTNYRKSFILVLGVPSLLLLLFVYLLNINKLTNLKENLLAEGNVIPRLDYMSIGIKIWNDHKLFGVGIDQYGRYAATYRSPEQIARDGYMVIPDKSHNVFIDHLANGGFFVAIFWIALILTISIMVIRAVIASDKSSRPMLAALSSIWFGWLVQSLISPDHFFLTFIGLSSAGLVIGSSNSISKNKLIDLRKRYYVPQNIALSLLLIFTLFFYSQTMLSDLKGKQILDKKIRNLDSIEEIIYTWPSPRVTELIGVELSKDPNNCVVLPRIAERLIRIESRSAQGWFMYAVCDIYRSNYTEAILKIQKSLTYDPSNPFYLTEKARLEIELMRYRDARKTIDLAKSIVPNDTQITSLDSKLKVSFE
jgi:tetratricopeptide (TPR) repeat protein